jgi:hypothetical protein
MKSAVRVWALVAIGVAVLARPVLEAGAGMPQAAVTGVIEGTVVRAGTTEGIADAQVSVTMIVTQTGAQLVRDAQNPPATTQLKKVSDSTGHFSLTAPEGLAIVRAQHDGYFGPQVNGTSPPTVGAVVTVSSRQPAHVQLAMVPGGAINGRVTDQTGKPVAATAVGVIRRIYRSGLPSLDLVDGKESDDRGAYRLYGLPPGEYFVVALQGHGGANAAAAAPGQPVVVTTFYPSAVDLATATPIAVKGGEDLAGFDIQIRSEITHTVSGHVTSNLPRGSEVGAINSAVRQPVAVLMMLPRDGLAIPDLVSGNLTANADGSFQIHGLLPGSYDLIARLPASVGWGPQNGPDRATNPWAFGRVPIEIGGADIDGVTVAVHQGVDVKGRLTVDGQPSAAAVRVTLQPDDNAALYHNFFGTISNWAPFLDTDGSFTFPLMPESHYRFRVGLTNGPTRAAAPNAQGQMPPTPVPLPPTAYVADIQQGGRSVYDEGITVGTDPVPLIEVIIKSGGGTIEGTVLGSDRKPAIGRSVVLVPEMSRRGNSALFKVATSDEQGSFTLTRVPPGNYKLFAWDSVVTGAYENPEFLQPYESHGVDVKVSGSGTVRVDLTVIAR